MVQCWWLQIKDDIFSFFSDDEIEKNSPTFARLSLSPPHSDCNLVNIFQSLRRKHFDEIHLNFPSFFFMLWDVRKIKLWGKRRRERKIYFSTRKTRRKVHRKSKTDGEGRVHLFRGDLFTTIFLNILLMISWMSGSIFLRYFFIRYPRWEIHTQKVILKYFNIESQMELFWFEHETFLIIFIWLPTRGIAFQSPSKINTQQRQFYESHHYWAEKFRVQKLKKSAEWSHFDFEFPSSSRDMHTSSIFSQLSFSFITRKKNEFSSSHWTPQRTGKWDIMRFRCKKSVVLRSFILCVTIVDQRDLSCNWRHSQSQNHSQLLTATSS